MRVLVTGGGGFIGPHAVEAYVTAGHRVRFVDRQPAHQAPGSELIVADLNDEGVAEVAVADVVSRHAARVGLGVDTTYASASRGDNDLATTTELGPADPR